MEKVKKAPKSGWMKFLCVIGGILMSILGILLFIKPVATTTVLVWLSFVGLLINGVIEIVRYFEAPKGHKEGTSLGLGILWVIISILMLAIACGAPFAAADSIKLFVVIMIGFTCIFAGICNICNCGQCNSAPLAIIGGILQIMVGFFVISNPVFGFLTLTIMFGIYLLVMGIVYIVNTLTNE